MATGYRAGGWFGSIAGVVSAVGSVLISVQFWQALIIATITGLLALIGTVLGAWIAARMAARAMKPVAESVEHVKRKVGASHRAEDSDGARP